ncbi:MAG: hypothetical protein NT172_02090 [Planctomycetota bacterium]|nr:hypothetical protein [Planctomycetota bacterium]
MNLDLGPKARSIPALGTAQGRLDKILFYHPSRPRPLAWAGLDRTVGD